MLQSVTVCRGWKTRMLSTLLLFLISAGLSAMSARILLHVTVCYSVLQCFAGPFPMSSGLFPVWVQTLNSCRDVECGPPFYNLDIAMSEAIPNKLSMYLYQRLCDCVCPVVARPCFLLFFLRWCHELHESLSGSSSSGNCEAWNSKKRKIDPRIFNSLQSAVDPGS